MEDIAGTRSDDTVVVVGVDEAGYGPLLGPLVVSASAFEVPVAMFHDLRDPAMGLDFWAILRSTISRKPTKNARRLAVADSKILHARSKEQPLALIERAALAFLMLCEPQLPTLRDLLRLTHPLAPRQLADYPWYETLDTAIPHAADVADVRTQANALRAGMAARGLSCVGLWSEVLAEGHFNHMVKATRNKAVVSFGLVTRLIQRIADHVGPRPMSIWVDRQGGRIAYRQPLMTAFEGADLEVLEESPERSGYRLKHGGNPWVIRFLTEGESHQMPIALASILSKYLRELLMLNFNRYWCARVPGLRPTAGYYLDGQRFLGEILPTVEQLKVPRERLVRML